MSRAAVLKLTYQTAQQAADRLYPPNTPQNAEAFLRFLATAAAVGPQFEDQGRVRALGSEAPATNLPTVSGRLLHDPEYLANQRALATQAIDAAGTVTERIFNGEDTVAYKFTALINLPGAICSGALIAKDVVITAAHCFCNTRQVLSVRFTPEEVGVFTTTARDGMAIVQSGCDAQGHATDLDLAVIFLQAPAPNAPIALSGNKVMAPKPSVRVVGWGETENHTYNAKKYVDVPIASGNCSNQVKVDSQSYRAADYYGCRAGTEFVAGKPGFSKDACFGDSGGPAMTQDGAAFKLVGLVSRSTDIVGQACGDGTIYELLGGRARQWLSQQGVSGAL